MDVELLEIHHATDSRGTLVDFLKRDQLPIPLREFGQMYYVTFDHMGSIRGKHYHHDKVEWFAVVVGKVFVKLLDLNTGETAEYHLEGNMQKVMRLRVGTDIVHTFICESDSATMINYASEPYHDASDTIRHDAENSGSP